MIKKILSGSILALSVLLNIRAFAQKTVSDYEIVAEDAAWCWFSDPRAVYHKGKQANIYYGYINSKGDVMISQRNMKSGEIQNYTLHEQLQVDDHNVPSILVLPDGHLLAFYTEHNGRFFMRKSKSPEDITSWEPERVIPFGGKRITYSHPVMLKEENNRIYMFWRGSDWRPSFAFSDDLGETWSPAQALIASKGAKNRPYLKVASDNKGRIDFAFTDGHPVAEPMNSVYHMYYENGKFYQTSGQLIASIDQVPLEHSKVKKVYDGTATGIRAWISDISLDKNKKPVLVYTRYPSETDHRYHYAAWDGSKWNDEEMTPAGSSMAIVPAGEKNRELFYSGGISLDHQSPANVYLSRQVNGIFELEHWRKRGDQWKVTPLTKGSEIHHMRPYVVAGNERNKPVLLWMTGHYTHYTNFKTDLRINK